MSEDIKCTLFIFFYSVNVVMLRRPEWDELILWTSAALRCFRIKISGVISFPSENRKSRSMPLKQKLACFIILSGCPCQSLSNLPNFCPCSFRPIIGVRIRIHTHKCHITFAQRHSFPQMQWYPSSWSRTSPSPFHSLVSGLVFNESQNSIKRCANFCRILEQPKLPFNCSLHSHII